MRHGLLSTAIFASSLGSCLRFGPPCPGQSYFGAEVFVDGRSTGVACRAPSVSADDRTSGMTTHGRPDVYYWIRMAAAPIWPGDTFTCGTVVEFLNQHLTTGASGTLQPRPLGGLEGMNPVVSFHMLTSGSDQRCGTSDDTSAVLRGGTWHVLAGGELGEHVEVEIRDVTLAPIAGHTYVIPFARWSATLPPSLR